MSTDETQKTSFLTKGMESLSQSPATQWLKAKWDEVDPNQQALLLFGGLGLGLLGILYYGGTSLWASYEIKTNLEQKIELLQYLHSANDELRSNGTVMSAEVGADPAQTLGSATEKAGIANEAITISPGKPGKEKGALTETLFEVKLTRVNILQLVKYAIFLESSEQPAKLRTIQLETEGSESSAITAKLSVSVFGVKK